MPLNRNINHVYAPEFPESLRGVSSIEFTLIENDGAARYLFKPSTERDENHIQQLDNLRSRYNPESLFSKGLLRRIKDNDGLYTSRIGDVPAGSDLITEVTLDPTPPVYTYRAKLKEKYIDPLPGIGSKGWLIRDSGLLTFEADPIDKKKVLTVAGTLAIGSAALATVIYVVRRHESDQQ